MKRTAMYMRVSSDKQVQEGDSIAAQRDALRKYIDSHDDLIFAGEYLDDGVSGTKENRDELQRLLAEVKGGRVDLIIATKLDRIYRSIRHYLNFQDTLDKCGCNWLAIWEPIYDTSTPQGRLIINQMMAIAQFEAENTGQRIRQVNAYKVSQGEVISGSVPPGYSIENKHLVPNDDAEAVRQIFQYYAKTGNLSATIRYSMQFGIFPTTGSAFKTILKNPLYIGRKRDNVNFCEPIIKKEVFEDVQRKMGMNVKSSQKRTYIFSGLLKCGKCGCAFAALHKRMNSKYPQKYNAYRCGKRYSTGGIKKCGNTKVFYEFRLEEYLLDNIRPMVRDLVLSYEVEQPPQVDYSARLAALGKKQERLKELYVNGLISLDEYKTDRERIEADKAALTVQNAPVRPDIGKLNELLSTDFETLYGTFTASEKRFFWRAIIQDIRLGADRSITVNFLP